MSTQEDAALRLALRSMLTEEDWWAQWVEDLLTEETPWTEDDRTRLVNIALDWATSTQPMANVVTLRKSLGEDSRIEERDGLPSQARLESTHDALIYDAMLAENDVEVEGLPVRPQDTAMTDLYGDPDWSELERQATQMAHAPWDVPPARLTQAIAAIKAGAVTLGTPASALAFCKSADGKRRYTVKESGCSCQATRPCYHMTAVDLYRLWQDKLAVPSLFPAPKTVDERLAEMPFEGERFENAPGSSQDVPVAVVEHDVSLASSAPPQIVSLSARVATSTATPAATVQMAGVPQGVPDTLQAYVVEHAALQRFIREHLERTVDYGPIHFVARDKCPALKDYRLCTTKAHWTKDTLFKPGAEKITKALGARPQFRMDEETWRMLGSPAGTLCYVCTLVTASGEVLGEGRGAADVKAHYGDVNKTIKMAEKSSQIDCVLRVAALSDVLTQDFDDGVTEVPEAAMPQAVARLVGHDQQASLCREIEDILTRHKRDITRTWAAAETQYGHPRDQLTLADLTDLKARVLRAVAPSL